MFDAICCECGERLPFDKYYCFTKPNGETVLGHKDCVVKYATRYKKKKSKWLNK